MISGQHWQAFRKMYIMLADDFRDAWRTYDLVMRITKEARRKNWSSPSTLLSKLTGKCRRSPT